MAAPTNGQYTRPSVAPTKPNPAPTRSRPQVESPNRLPVWNAHALQAPTKPVQAPRIADVTAAEPPSRVTARPSVTHATTDTTAPSQPRTGRCSTYLIATKPTVPMRKRPTRRITSSRPATAPRVRIGRDRRRERSPHGHAGFAGPPCC